MTEFTSYPDVTPTEDGGSQISESEEQHDEGSSGDEGEGENPSGGGEENPTTPEDDEEVVKNEISEEEWNNIFLNKGLVTGDYNFEMGYYLSGVTSDTPEIYLFDYCNVYFADYYYTFYQDRLEQYVPKEDGNGYIGTEIPLEEYLSLFKICFTDVPFKDVFLVEEGLYGVEEYENE